MSRVRALVADHREPVTFFCGGSRNFSKFIDLFDGVFVLDVDLETLLARLDQRPADEWGAQASEREPIVRLHHTREDIPRTGVVIDAKPAASRSSARADRGAGDCYAMPRRRRGSRTTGLLYAPPQPS